jgi:hypothetical protein
VRWGRQKARQAGVDLRQGRLIAYSMSVTRSGVTIANGEFVMLPEAAGDRDLGGAVRQMLDRTRTGVRDHRPRDPSPFSPVLSALGVRSYTAYARGTLSVGVEQEHDRVVVTPSRNGGPREGMVGLQDRAVDVTGPDDLALGEAVRTALSRSV